VLYREGAVVQIDETWSEHEKEAENGHEDAHHRVLGVVVVVARCRLQEYPQWKWEPFETPLWSFEE
jgi:hypothetical protein